MLGATALVVVVFAAGSFINGVSLGPIFRASLISIDSYTYFPQLIFPLEEMMLWYVGFSIITLFSILPLYFKYPQNWKPALVFVLFIIAFISLREINFIWVDKDLIYQSLSILLVIQAGVFYRSFEILFSI